ncbi:MAG: gluconeogenesis factor YvcK family protein [archaeon]
MEKIVTIGGGTGQFQILKGLRDCECEITAITNVSDNGGSSGKLIDEYGILPPGDIRQCLVALASKKDEKILRELFNYRLKDGHSMGNLIITALADISGGFISGVRETGKLLNISGQVLPVSSNKFKIYAETTDGKILNGEEAVSYSQENSRIKRLFAKEKVFLLKDAGEAIRNADKIVICAGDLYGSILPNFLVNGILEALQESSAKKIYVCNLFTKKNTEGFKAKNFVEEIEKYSQIKLDRIIVNSRNPSSEVLKKYIEEYSLFVEDDLGEDSRVIRGDYVAEYPFERKTIFRHVPEKIAQAILEI